MFISNLSLEHNQRGHVYFAQPYECSTWYSICQEYWVILKIVRSCSNSMFNFLRNHYTVFHSCYIITIQFSSVASNSLRPHESQHARPPCPSNSWSLLKFMPIELVMPSSHLILCRPLLLLPPVPPSIRVFSNESALRMRWPKYWSFSFNISPPNEHLGLLSFRMDWLDLLAVQGTLESSPTPQFKSINFLVLSFLHSPTLTSIHDHWKNHSLD